MLSKNLMNFFIWFTLISVIRCLSFITEDEYNATLQVSTRYGVVQGKEVIVDNGSPYFAYLGIPYAAPPLNYLRFRNPHQPKPWKGVLNATEMPTGCIELQFRTIGRLIHVLGTEDCLYINVYSPSSINEKNGLPVIFYIYGGAFVEGTSSSYQPDYLIQHDLIVVTFNYRGGVFGFLSTEDKASYGNYGLKDQFAALKWVNANIKKFGGDPNKVTVAGHSSGAYSTIFLMMYPKSRGLFRTAIAMSGEAYSPFGRQKFPRRVAFDVGLSLGIETQNSTELVERLRELDVESLKFAQKIVLLVGTAEILNNGLLFTPVIEPDHEDAILKNRPDNLLEKGNFVKVPLIIGMTSLEMATLGQLYPVLRPLLLLYELSPGTFPNILEVDSVTKKRAVGRKIRKKYISSGDYVKATIEEVIQLLSDLMYVQPITNCARTMSAFVPVYLYVFEYSINATKTFLKDYGMPIDMSLSGVGHVEDLAYIWRPDIVLPPEGIRMRSRMTKIWSNFAKYGNPTPTPDPFLQNVVWPPLSKSTDVPYLRINRNFSLSKNYRMEYVNFLNKLRENAEDL